MKCILIRGQPTECNRQINKEKWRKQHMLSVKLILYKLYTACEIWTPLFAREIPFFSVFKMSRSYIDFWYWPCRKFLGRNFNASITDFVCLIVPVLMKVNFVLYRKTHTRVCARANWISSILYAVTWSILALLEASESKCSHFKVKNKVFRVCLPWR